MASRLSTPRWWRRERADSPVRELSPAHSRPTRPSVWARVREAPEPGLAPRSFWREHWPVLLIVALAGALRLHGLSQRILIYDEYLLFNVSWLKNGLSIYTHDVWSNTTYNPGWAIVVWIFCRLLGPSALAVRLPSLIAGALAPAVVYGAGRSIGLSRQAGLWAGLIATLAVFQLEYSQQALPYAILPLGSGVCVWLVTRLVRPNVRDDPRRLLAHAGGLSAVFGAMVFVHNSTLLLAPALLLYWGWDLVRPTMGARIGDHLARWHSAACWLFCAIAVSLASACWLYAKLDEADRDYLHPYFPGTFRAATDRHFVSDLIDRADAWYAANGPERTGWESDAVDTIYFYATRVFDFVFGHFRVLPEQHQATRPTSWLVPLAAMTLLGLGAWGAIRGRNGPSAFRWVACALIMLGFGVVLSSYRLYPLGGIRQLIVLSPLVILVTAFGIDQRGLWASRIALSAAILWAAGTLGHLPRYYRTTCDPVRDADFARLADQFNVRQFAAGDAFCSIGSLRLHTLSVPGSTTLRCNVPEFADLTTRHEPFFLCSLHDPLFTAVGEHPVPDDVFGNLAHPSAVLNDYTATPVLRPRHTVRWLDWTVYLMRPRPGPYCPVVIDVTPIKDPLDQTPRSYAVRFSQPMRADDLNESNVRLVPQSPSGRWDTQANVPIRLEYLDPSRTLLVTPRAEIRADNYLLAITRSVRDQGGHPLDANDREFYFIDWGRPKDR